MKKALIISGGEYDACIGNDEYDYIIACDKGVKYAFKMGFKPDLILGDFDSLDEKIPDSYKDVEVQTFPVMKDDTDTMLAIKEALRVNCSEITLCCALGGHLDHLLANIESLHYIAKRGAVGKIEASKEHVRTLSGGEKLTLCREPGSPFSLIALSDECEGLCIRGAKYNGEGLTLSNSFPLGHGNSFVDDKVEISIDKGQLLIVESV